LLDIFIQLGDAQYFLHVSCKYQILQSLTRSIFPPVLKDILVKHSSARLWQRLHATARFPAQFASPNCH
jgi:hypothetical protein